MERLDKWDPAAEAASAASQEAPSGSLPWSPYDLSHPEPARRRLFSRRSNEL